jgi:hypothetical protein
VLFSTDWNMERSCFVKIESRNIILVRCVRNIAVIFRLEHTKELFRTKWSRYLIVLDMAEMETVLVCSDWRMERSCFVQSGAGI